MLPSVGDLVKVIRRDPGCCDEWMFAIVTDSVDPWIWIFTDMGTYTYVTRMDIKSVA